MSRGVRPSRIEPASGRRVSAVSNLIREKKTYQLYSVMQTGKALGMVTLNDSLLALVRNGSIDKLEALRLSVNKSEMMSLLGREDSPEEAPSPRPRGR